MIKHCEDLRALSYSILTELFLGNGRLANEFVRNRFNALPGILVRDVMILPHVLEEDESRADEACSENLNNEGLELLLALLTVKELQPFIVEKGATREFLVKLQEYVNDCELGSNTNMVASQLTQVLAELKN